MARGLDSSGFADLEVSMAFHEAVTSKLDRDDPEKFAQVWSSMSRCWDIEPTSQRFVQDILGWLCMLKMIMDAEGCAVHGEAIRSGHRAVRSDEKGALTTCLRTRQCKG